VPCARLEDFDFAIDGRSAAGDAELFAVQRERDGDDDVSEARDLVAFLSREGVPDRDLAEAARNEIFAVRRPSHRLDERDVSALDVLAFLRLQARRIERANVSAGAGVVNVNLIA